MAKRVRVRDYSGQFPREKTLEGYTGTIIDQIGQVIEVEDGIIISGITPSVAPEGLPIIIDFGSPTSEESYVMTINGGTP